MTSSCEQVVLPLSKTARLYGYITWRKRYDPKMRAVLGNRRTVDLHFADTTQKKKTIDWEKRRIGITYTLTRSLPKTVRTIRIRPVRRGQVTVIFE